MIRKKNRTNSDSLTGRRGRPWWVSCCLAALLLVASCSQSTDAADPGNTAVITEALTNVPSETISVELPTAVSADDVTILGRGTVRLNDSVTVTRASGGATQVVNMGWGETNLGVESKVMHVTSRARVVLRDRAKASGNVISSTTVQRLNGATIAGSVLQNTAIASNTLTWPVPLRSTSRGAIQLEPDLSLRADPGTYGPVHVKSRSTLRLRSGVYLFDSLFLEPEAKLLLDDADGLVEIYLRGDFTFRGSTKTVSGAFPKLLVVTTGTNQVTVDAPFRGSIVAPHARIALISTSSGHEGTFFGKDVEVQPGTPIRHNTPNWDRVLNGPSVVKLNWQDGSAILRAAEPADADGVTDGHVSLPELIGFTIPSRLRVEQGSARNYPAVLRFRDQQRNVVSCTYRGGSSVANPVTPLDVAKALHYDFHSCTNGATAGSFALGNEFWLTIDALPDPALGFTAVEVHLNGCGGEMEPAIEPEAAVQMVDAFSWQQTSPVPEYDAQGRPTLYYALIYVQDHEQAGALEDALIHWDPMPLFKEELARFDGQCGTVRGTFDGDGQFVYALLPGMVYNQLRQYVISPEIDPETGEDSTVFDAVILRTPPAGAANPDGSVSYAALMESAFKYLDLTDLPLADDEVQQPRRKGKFRRFCRKVAKKVGKAARGLVRGVVQTLGAVDLAISKNHELYLTLKVNNRDPLFKGEMKQAWGKDPWAPEPGTTPDANNPGARAARPVGPKIDIKLQGFGGFLPTQYTDRADYRGIAHLKVPRSDQFAGVLARGKNPVCMHLENDAAMITTYLFYDRVCDFGSDTTFNFRGSSSSATLESDHRRIHLFNALTDAHAFFDKVMEYHPHRVQVLTGWFANGAGSPPWGDHPAFAGCMGLNYLGDDDFLPLVIDSLVQTATSVGQGVSPVPVVPPPGLMAAATIPLAQADIVMPDNRHMVRSSRSMVAHEYGHFALCSLLYRADARLLPRYITQRILEGQTIDAEDDVSVMSDAFADFVAGQVAGSVNYPNPTGAVSDLWGTMGYCAANAPTAGPCMEGNANGTPQSGSFLPHVDGTSATAAGLDALAKVGTTWRDVFDGHYRLAQERTDVPGNVDYYAYNGSTLDISDYGLGSISGVPPIDANGDGFLDDDGIRDDDENVSLPGKALLDWFNKWYFEMDLSLPFAMYTLDQTMKEYGVSWCDRCDLFTLHEAVAPTGMRARWTECSSGAVSEYMGPAPDALLNMRRSDCAPCPAGSYSDDAHPECRACAPGQIVGAAGCMLCLPGTAPSADGRSCELCPPRHISKDGRCEYCGLGKGADRGTNTCVPCPDDDDVNWGVESCTDAHVPVAAAAAPNDICPDEFWLRVTGLAAGGPMATGLDAELGAAAPASSCATEAAFGVYDTAGTQIGYLYTPQGAYVNPSCGSGPCTSVPHCTWPTGGPISGPDILRLMVALPDGPAATLTLSAPIFPSHCRSHKLGLPVRATPLRARRPDPHLRKEASNDA